MRITEILTEDQLNELSLAGGLGKVAGALGKGVGSVKGAWQGATDAYTQARDRTAKVAQRNVARGGGVKSGNTSQPFNVNRSSGASNTQTPSTFNNQTSSVSVSGNEVDQILQMVSKLDTNTKKDLVSKIQGQDTPAATKQPTPTKPNFSGGHTQGAVPKVNYSFNANTKPAAAPVKPAPEPEDDNPNIVKGYNEDVGYSRFLGISI